MSGLDEQALRKLRHDLSSPLMIIAGFAQLLTSERTFSDAERREYAQRIDDASKQVREIVDTTIEAARNGAGAGDAAA
jgi:signal transduction histidine kinase